MGELFLEDELLNVFSLNLENRWKAYTLDLIKKIEKVKKMKKKTDLKL